MKIINSDAIFPDAPTAVLKPCFCVQGFKSKLWTDLEE